MTVYLLFWKKLSGSLSNFHTLVFYGRHLISSPSGSLSFTCSTSPFDCPCTSFLSKGFVPSFHHKLLLIQCGAICQIHQLGDISFKHPVSFTALSLQLFFPLFPSASRCTWSSRSLFTVLSASFINFCACFNVSLC